EEVIRDDFNLTKNLRAREYSMDEIEKQRKKRKRMLIIIIGIAAAALILFLIFSPKDDSSAEDQYKTEEIIRRDIVSSVSGTGVIKAKESEEVSADITGSKITQVYVSEGDEVKKGDRLVAFDVEELMETREDTAKDLEDAREDKAQTIEDREEQDDRYDREMEERYDEYHMNLEIAKENLETANATYDEAKKDLADYQKLYNQTDFSSASDNARAQMDQTLAAKKQNVETARNNKNSARQSYETILNSDDNSLPDAKKNYDDMAESSIENYDRLIENYEDTLKRLDEQLEDAVLYAPADGTVTEVHAEVDDTYYGGTLVVIEGMDVLYVEATVGEYDIPDVKKGMRAVLKTDATRNDELTGEVSYIAPKSTNSMGSGGGGDLLSGLGSTMGGGLSDMDLSNVPALGGAGSSEAEYTIKIDLDDTNERLRIGMNAKISIVLQEADNVISVPMEAVQTKDDDKKYIYLVKKDAEATEEKEEKKSWFSFWKKKDEDKDDSKEEAANSGKSSKDVDKTAILAALYDEVEVQTGLEGTYYVELITDEDIEGRQVVIPDSDSVQSVDDLLNVMGSAGGI
nr:efflux RND transporter periplasmic adaptor subunit [Lachnospiraceae bacterium]